MSRTFILAVVLICASPVASRASAKMFPADLGSSASGDAMPTRLVRTDAVVTHGLALVKTEYRFDNEAYEQIEGLLKTRVPRNAVVTDFAYYFKGVRVPGRIMENEEAERIYRAITSAGRDPALLRRKSDGSYEARIFPIEPRSEIRVELEYRYAIPESPGRLKLFLPLATGDTGKAVDRVQVSVAFSGDPVLALTAEGMSAALTQLPPPDPTASRTLTTSFEGSAVELRRDLLVTALLAESASHVELLTANAEGEDGYWALRLRGRGVEGAALRGLRVRHRFPGKVAPDSVTRYWFGRMRAGDKPSGAVDPAPVEPTQLSPLWAQSYTSALVAKYRRRHQPSVKALVVDLSKRFRIDTELTSYLAIPDSEWAAYQDRLDQAKRDDLQQYHYETDALKWVAQLPRWVVPGDPVIRVQHRPGMEQVTALLPDGDVLPLRLDPTTGIWEARFDIPEGAREGAYPVVVVLQESGGRRSEVKLTYQVDLTSPTGAVRLLTDDGPRLELTASADTARAVLLLADGSRQELNPSEPKGETRRMTTGLRLSSGRHAIRIRLYDRVHNWIELEDEINVP
ncbi:MAG: VIT domain-containing protein [Actinomycetota bacterium]